MSADDLLSVLSIVGLLVAFVSGLIPQVLVTSEQRGARKYLTPAGIVAMGISALGLMISLGSGLLKISIAHDQEVERARAARENARDEAESKRQQLAEKREAALWRQRADSLTGQILANTDKQLSDSDRNIAATLAQFQRTQLQQTRTMEELQTSTNRILLPTGRLTYTVTVTYECSAGSAADACQLRELADPAALAAGRTVTVRYPSELAVTPDHPITLAVNFFLLRKGVTGIRINNGTPNKGDILMLGTLRASLQERERPDLILFLRPNSVSLSVINSAPSIPPIISREVASMLDLEDREILLLGPDLENAQTLRFSMNNPESVDLSTDCEPTSVRTRDMAFADESFRASFVCLTRTVF